MMVLGDTAYLVFCSKREGYNSDIVFECLVHMVHVDKDGSMYGCTPLRCVNRKDINVNSYSGCLCFRDVGINSGKVRDMVALSYPVFTNLEDCKKWVKGR